ncbi:unnamed protein product [Cylindrotheca closterium]|uniref:DUF6824 domain-containing protein n=1 Tax=Cylindrotheca closterium TaxID=2856 RepID=A0AAD2GBQ7_9STRA|nr:unnamed protein product [Cylindrotheca closterium]
MMNQILQSITNNNNSNNGNDQSPSFVSILEAYQREKTMNEMIFKSLLSSSLQSQAQQSQAQHSQAQSQAQLQQNQQQHHHQQQGPNYAAILAAANAQNELNQQQQFLQQALLGRPMNNSGLPALMPSSANTVSDSTLLAFLQGNHANGLNALSSSPSAPPPTAQDHANSNPFGQASQQSAADTKLFLSSNKDNKIDLDNFKASSLLPNLKSSNAAILNANGLSSNGSNKDLSTLDTAALLKLLTSVKTGGPTPAPAPSMAAPVAPPAPGDAALLAMIQQVQQHQQQHQQQQQQVQQLQPQAKINITATASSTPRTSSPVNSFLSPVSPNNNTSTANLAMAVEIASSSSNSNNKNTNNSRSNKPLPTKSTASCSFIETQNEDVLFGKGRTKHQGNRHLQKLIENLMAVYEAATKHQKKELADMVVTKILNSGGRFLKLDDDAQRWVEVEREDAHKKVAHAFRNLRRRTK